MTTTELFLVAMLIVFTVPYLIWRLGRTGYFAPLVVVRIVTGILLGPGELGAAFLAWEHRVESGITAGLSLFAPPTVGGLAGLGMLQFRMHWLDGVY